MNRLLILLFMVGWAFYIVQVTRPADAVQSEQNAKTSTQAAPGQEAVTQSEIQSIARAEVRSPHAITPDEPPQKAPVSSEATPPPHPAQNSESQPSSSQPVASDPTFEPGEQLRVTAQTSIRSGPTEAAEVIGTAHAGAKLRVKSSEAGWVQFIDPAAQKSGWISLAYLAPSLSLLHPPRPSSLSLPRLPGPSRRQRPLSSSRRSQLRKSDSYHRLTQSCPQIENLCRREEVGCLVCSGNGA